MEFNEQDPRLGTLEARALAACGFGKYVYQPVALGDQVVEGVFGHNFLSAYGDSPHRQRTEELLDAFLNMSPDDPDYADTREYLEVYFQAYFGDPEQG